MDNLPSELDSAVYGFMSSHVLFALEELGVFTELSEESGDARSLADRLGVHEPALSRLLTAGVSLGLLRRERGTLSIPPHLAPYLDVRSDAYCAGAFPHFRDISSSSFAHLADTVRRGRSEWWEKCGQSDNEAFDFLYADPTRRERFARAMWAMGYRAAKDLAPLLPVEDRPCTLLDLGGGNGSFAVAALQHWPQLQAVVADLPAMRELVEASIEQHGLSDRLSFAPCDFFADPLPSADMYALGFVLSDWSTDAGSTLIARVYEALPPGGWLFILERLFDDEKSGPRETALMDLCMLLETEGRHRTESEYLGWLEQAGFVHCKVERSQGQKHVVMGMKPHERNS